MSTEERLRPLGLYHLINDPLAEQSSDAWPKCCGQVAPSRWSSPRSSPTERSSQSSPLRSRSSPLTAENIAFFFWPNAVGK